VQKCIKALVLPRNKGPGQLGICALKGISKIRGYFLERESNKASSGLLCFGTQLMAADRNHMVGKMSLLGKPTIDWQDIFLRAVNRPWQYFEKRTRQVLLLHNVINSHVL